MDYKKEIKKGELLYEGGEIDQAESVFKRVLQEDSENHEALNNLGVISIMRGNSQEAEECFRKALAVKDDYQAALLNLADLYHKTKRWKETIIQLERYLEIDSSDHNIYNQLGVAYLEIGDFKGASDVLGKSLEIKPDQKGVLESLSALKGRAKPSKVELCENSLKILFVQEASCIRNYKMASALRARGHRVSLAYTKARLSQMYKGLSDEVYKECIKLESYRQLWDISMNYDIVHCHNEPDILSCAALAGDTPVVHDTHDLISLRANGDQNLAYFEGLANRGAAGRVYSTPYQMNEAKKLYGINGNSLVYYNYASESDLPKKYLPKLSDKDSKVHIVYEGGIGGNEHRDFSSLFIELSNNDINIHIYPTFYNRDIAQLFSAYENVHYYQPMSPKQIMQEMTKYDFGIIPFNLEKGNKRFLDSTIANKLFEYLAAGLPVITSPLKTYIDYFEKNPVGITYNTAQDIIDNIPKLKEIASRTNFSKNIFTYEKEIERLENFYENILKYKKEKTKSDEINIDTDDYLQHACQRLISWIEHNGWDGYDPYDIQDYFIQKAKKGMSVPPEKQKEILQKANINPIKVREELGIVKKRNAKALGLLMAAWVRIYKATNEEKYLKESERIADWLLVNPSKGYDNLCWGYPFDWQSVIFIPIDTPSAVVSTAVGDGLWELYSVTRNEKYLKACVSICRFITEDLKMDDMGAKGICFSYTPIDEYHVHNANLFCGEFLARVGNEIEKTEWLKLSERTADYAISEQNDDGSIYYWGKIQNNYAPDKLDHYHSGFEIRCLYNIARHLKLDKIKRAYQNYLDFYLHNYLLPDGTPKIVPSNPYPVNIHGAAECVLMFSILSGEHPELLPLARKTLQWTIKNMQKPDGWFGYIWTPTQRIDAPFLRWGQAWMIRAFAEYNVAEKVISKEWGYYSEINPAPGRKSRITSGLNRNEELEELRKLACVYAKMDNGKIPLHVINSIADKIKNDLTPENKIRIILESLSDPVKWQNNVVDNKKQLQPETTSQSESQISRKDYQFMMPETGQLQYGSKEWAEALFKNSDTDPWGHDWRASQKVRYQSAMDLLNKHVLPDKINDVLDIGCALGDFTKMLRGYFPDSDLLGVDISDEAIRKCRKIYDNIQFESSSLPDLKLPGKCYNFVSALEVIYYVGENKIDQSLQRINEITEKGGYILISTYLNKPPFLTSDKFKKALSKFFIIADETIRYHGLYTQYETVIRQSMDVSNKLTKIIDARSSPIVSEYVRSGIKVLGDVNIMNQINKYTKDNIGEKGISHSIVLAIKK